MPSEERACIIRDPVHGAISLTEQERRILDSPAMQRLRHVRQLGMAHLVYPGAHHTRFEHSLGCLSLADAMARALALGEDDRRRLRMSALLHDVGHLAFSHDSESVTCQRLGDHEARGARLIGQGVLAELVRETDSPGLVARWMQGARFGQLITSDVGADRIDYLLRDAHYTGVAYGVVDWVRILSTLRWAGGAPALRAGGLEAAESLIMARFEMFHAVYYHHTVRIIRSMLQAAIVEGMESGQVDLKAMQLDGDSAMLARLKAVPRAGRWVEALHARRLHKRALVADWKELDKRTRQEALDGRLARKLSQACGCDVLVSAPEPFRSRTTIAMRMPEGALPLEEASPLVASLQKAAQSRAQLVVAAPARQAASAGRQARKELGL